jgi:hypothetical protein
VEVGGSDSGWCLWVLVVVVIIIVTVALISYAVVMVIPLKCDI